MNILHYLEWNELDKLNNFADIKNIYRFCNLNIYTIGGNLKNNQCVYDIPRVFDILDKIIIILNNHKFLEFYDIQYIEINIFGYKNLKLFIEDFNIIYQNDNITVLNFELLNLVKYFDTNIGGLPLFLFDYYHCPLKLLVNLKNKKEQPYELCSCSLNFLQVCVGGNTIISEYLHKHYDIKKNLMYNLIPKLQTNQKHKIINELIFFNPNEKINFENKNRTHDNILNYRNVISYKKIYEFDDYDINMRYDLELEQETTHLIFRMNLTFIDNNMYLRIRMDDYDIFDSDIYTLYYKGYFIFKFNTKILDSKISLYISNSHKNNSVEDIDNKLNLELFNVYDII